MEQDPDKQNNMQSSAAAAGANDISSEDDETAIDEELDFNSLPCGYRFAPTDDELLKQYLMKKVNDEPLPPNVIPEVILYTKDPTQLIEEYKPITETEWYFFTPRDKKYPNGTRPNRATPNGYWKPTGTDKAIPHCSKHSVGFKKTLDFYKGKHPGGTKTDWKMHEYTVKDSFKKSQNNDKPKDDMTLDDWVLCRIYKKREKINGGDEEISIEITQPPSPVKVAENNEASLMVGKNNEFEDQGYPNANQSSVNLSVQNNGAASSMPGNNYIVSENQNSNDDMESEYQNSNAASQQAVNGASSMAKNNNNVYEYQNLNASQQAVNGASSMAENNNIFVSEYQNSNASSQQAVNGASSMAENNNIFVFEYQNSNASSQQAVNGASSMAENNNIFVSEYQNLNASQQAVNGASSMAGKNNNFVSEYQNSNASSQQAVNGASPMAGNYNSVSEYQNSNASSQQAVNGASSMAPGNNNNIGFEDQNSNSTQPTVNETQNNEASSLMAAKNNIGFEDQNPNETKPTVNETQNNEASSMAENNNIEFEDQNLDATQPTPNQESMPHETPFSMVSQSIVEDQFEKLSYMWEDKDSSTIFDGWKWK